MIQTYCLSVPCKGYIRKYFSAIYGEIIDIDHRNDFGDTVLTKMTTKPLSQVNHNMLNLNMHEYKEKITFRVPFDFFYRIDNNITPQQIYNINRYLENVFKSDFYLVVNCASVFGVEIRTSIESFARKYNIALEEEITFDALQKSYYRYRKSSTAKNNFLLQMSTPFKLNLRA